MTKRAETSRRTDWDEKQENLATEMRHWQERFDCLVGERDWGFGFPGRVSDSDEFSYGSYQWEGYADAIAEGI